jgi:hypothetical protein
MSKLIEVDKIEWKKGVFVNPNTEEPLPIIHKIATIEMLRDFQEEVKAIPTNKVKKAIDEMKALADPKNIILGYDEKMGIKIAMNTLVKNIGEEVESK